MPFDHLPIGVFLVDADFRYQFANRAFADYLGYRPQDFVGRPVQEGVYPTDLPVYREHAEKAAQGATAPFEITMRARGGSAYRIHVQGIPFISEDGTFAGGIGVAQPARLSRPPDISEIRRLSLLTAHYAGELHSLLSLESADAYRFHTPTRVTPELSQRETEVCACLLQGLSAPTIAERLHVSPHTIRNHVKSIYRKLEVRSRAELMARFSR